MSNKIVNLFWIATELQCLTYIALKEKQPEKHYVVFTNNFKTYEFLRKKGDIIHYITDDSFFRGWIGSIISLKKNLRKIKNTLKEKIENGDRIIYHTARIDTLFANLIIGYLKKYFKFCTLDVCLITDGTINIVNTDAHKSIEERLTQYKKKLKIKIFSDFKITTYSGNLLGANADIVKGIYLFKGMPTTYPREKVKYIDFPIKNKKEKENKKAALVIGQKIKASDKNSDQFINAVTQKIISTLEDHNITEIAYLPHPRSNHNEFSHEDFDTLSEVPLCAEYLIGSGNFSHVFSCSSSVLINAKLVCGDAIEVFSVGLSSFHLLNTIERTELKKHYDNIGIHCLEIKKQHHKHSKHANCIP